MYVYIYMYINTYISVRGQPCQHAPLSTPNRSLNSSLIFQKDAYVGACVELVFSHSFC